MDADFSYTVESRKSFRIRSKMAILSPQEKLWKILTTPGHLENFHPHVAAHQSPSNWGGVGAKDQGRFCSGKEMKRKVVEWQEGLFYTIKMDNDDGINTFVEFNLSEINAGRTEFSVCIETDAYRKVPRPIWYLFARIFLVPSFKKYLYSVLKGLEYYSRTGKKVKKNQFGRHRKFSP